MTPSKYHGVVLKQWSTGLVRIIDKRFKVIKGTSYPDHTLFVHAPDPVGGTLLPGTVITVRPLLNVRVCSHGILARLRSTPEGLEWAGANPSVGQQVAYLAMARGMIPGLTLIRKQVKCQSCRLDALCQWQGRTVYVQIKGVQNIKSSRQVPPNTFVFPQRRQRDDMTGTPILPANTISPRAVRQGHLLAKYGGMVLYVCIGGIHSRSHRLVINPLDTAYYQAYRRLPGWVLYTYWADAQTLCLDRVEAFAGDGIRTHEFPTESRS